MRILVNWIAQTDQSVTAIRWIEAVIPFFESPAVVFLVGTAGGLKIHLFPGVLPHVGNIEVPGQSVEGVAPRIAQAVGPNFFSRADRIRKGIAGWNLIALSSVNVNSQNFPQQAEFVLAVILWVSGASTVPGSNIQVTVVRPKANP